MQVQTIMPKRVLVIPPKPEYSGENRIDIRPKRVAAYCRVSTDNEDQESSIKNQKVHYEELINGNPDYEYAGIYYDHGIS